MVPKLSMFVYVKVSVRCKSALCIRERNAPNKYYIHTTHNTLEKIISEEAFSFSCPKVLSFLDHSCTILISFKIVVLFNITLADFVFICIEKYHNFERNEHRATVFLKRTERTLAFISKPIYSNLPTYYAD